MQLKPANHFKYLTEHEVAIWMPATVGVPICGHNMDPRSEPRHQNCQPCWNVYFQAHPQELTAAVATMQQLGAEPFRGIRSAKWIKAIKKITVAWDRFQAAEAERKKNEQKPSPEEVEQEMKSYEESAAAAVTAATEEGFGGLKGEIVDAT